MKLALTTTPLLAFALACSGEPARDAQHANAAPSAHVSVPPTIQLPNGAAGIGFDDLRYSTTLGRVLVPAGRTGELDLVDPATGAVTQIAGFGSKATYSGGHGDGVTSVDEGAGFLFAVDRTMKRVDVVDAAAKKIVAFAPLAADPDYVRWVAATNEVWVTEPDTETIEIFRFTPGEKPAIEHAGEIVVHGGPESLVIDAQRGRAYTHLWERQTVSIDVRTRKIVAFWKNGCRDSRGIALDEKRGFLFAAGAEGIAVVLDVEHDGKQLGSARTGEGVDIIDYDAARGHLYVPAGKSATLTILGVSAAGELAVLGSAPIAQGAHCATSDGNGRVFVGHPAKGELLVIADEYAASGR